jgi:hypothetical protein
MEFCILSTVEIWMGPPSVARADVHVAASIKATFRALIGLAASGRTFIVWYCFDDVSQTRRCCSVLVNLRSFRPRGYLHIWHETHERAWRVRIHHWWPMSLHRRLRGISYRLQPVFSFP